MKKYLLLTFVGLILILNGCKKDSPNTPSPIPEITIQNINFPSFVNSNWINVFGGTGLLQFDLLNSSNGITSTIKDSTNLNNISLYSKILLKGTYNIYLSSKDQTSVADTFIRFNAQLTSFSLIQKQAASLTGTTKDGLITISQSLVQANTVPSFSADSGKTSFKFALINGFYYLYVTGGKTGKVTFTYKATGQLLTKNVAVVTLNQYNLAVQTNSGTLQVVFAPFAYNNVGVSSNTLLTIKINTGDYYFINSNVYFVATDQNGTVLNAVKYVQGTTTFKLSSLTPFQQERFNFYVILAPTVGTFNPSITGYLQVKKGSVYTDIVQPLPQKPFTTLKPHLLNAPNFDNLDMSTASIDRAISKLSDSTNLQQLVYQDSSKLWVQMLSNNQYTYNFFNIPKGTVDLNVDLNQLTETPLSKTVTAPVGSSNFYFGLNAKPDTNYSAGYRFGFASTSSNTGTLYYPREIFPEYDVQTGYLIGNLSYSFVLSGSTIPSQVPAFNASFDVVGDNLTNVELSYSGVFDYYHASFLNTNSGSNLKVDLYSPSLANCTSFHLPDFSNYLGTPFHPELELLVGFQLEQYDGFNEQNFTYKDVNEIFSFHNFNCKSVALGSL
ncbi:hypothetical protein [Mucilaginibacter sp.]